MDNGCICCSVRGDLVKALVNFLPRRHTFDCILLETTGIADPSPIVSTFNQVCFFFYRQVLREAWSLFIFYRCIVELSLFQYLEGVDRKYVGGGLFVRPVVVIVVGFACFFHGVSSFPLLRFCLGLSATREHMCILSVTLE